MTDLRQQLATLSPEKQQLLLSRLKAKQSSGKLQPIPCLTDRETYPLSFAQQRLWFLQQLDPQSTNYHIPGGLRLQGDLQVAALQQSLQMIVDRHSSLRTNFVATVEGSAQQVVRERVTAMLPLVDLRHLEAQAQAEQVQRCSAALNDTPFDLTRDPLLRIQLLQLADREHLLLFCMHHIVADGWSMGILTQELATLYTALVEERGAALPELAIQYPDFAHWQRQLLSGELREKQLNYWQQQLSGLPPRLDLATDRPRPTVQTFTGAQAVFELAAGISQGVEKLSQQAGATAFMTLLAAFQLLLHRYTGQPDIAVGSPIANRNRPEIENLIGFFVNTLVLRTDFSGQPTFRELLARVQATALGAYQHQDMPFDLIVEAVQPERDLSYSPLFQVMFVLQNAAAGELQLPNLALSPVPNENHSAKFDLTLSIDQGEKGMVCAWEYNTDLFDRATIDRFQGHFQCLLEAIIAHPEWPIDQLPFVTPGELEQLAAFSQSGHPALAQAHCLPALFEQQVAQQPDQIAVVEGTHQLTYGELNRRANQLAHALQAQGIGPEALVGIYMERSIDLIVGMVAIIKAGGAYVPLDPAYPAERLALMVADTGLSIILTQRALLGNLGWCNGAPPRPPGTPPLEGNSLGSVVDTLICLDEFAYQGADENLDVSLDPTNLAYIIYTSGSTGKPKGVMIPQQGISRLVLDTNYVQLTAGDRIAQASNTAFDAATFEVWGALLNGAQLVVVPRATLLSPADLAGLLQDQKITVLFLTPALFNQMASLVPTAFHQLRYLIMGGEALDPHSVRVVMAAGGPQHLLNGYGPTESTTFATWYEATNLNPMVATIPIGRPIAQTEIQILDKYLQPVPIGVPGELYIGGNGLARGYWQRPELTASQFIPHPFSDRPGDRLYKTGDLVRYLPQGAVEYLGRIDQQVKIRGFRIELGEIEAVLSQHPQLQQASVQAISHQTGQKQLVAYTVATTADTPSASDLRQFLASRLPDYMLPQAFVSLAALPLTPNGKIDRRALPAPDFSALSAESYVAPRTETEQKLAQIWQEVLGLAQVGIHDNFFGIGGDSILSLQIIARANQSGLQLTPKQLFAHQSIGELAQVAGTGRVVPAEQGLVTGPVPLTPIQSWFLAQEGPGIEHFNQSVLLQLPPGVAVEYLQQVLASVFAHHDALRLQFTATDRAAFPEGNRGYQAQLAGLESSPCLQVVDLGDLSGPAQADRLTEICNQVQGSMELGSGCLLRATLFQMGAGQPPRLLIAVHHLAIDGVSWRILLADIQTAYQQLSQHQPIALPPKTTSWRCWAERLTAAAGDFVGELDYWQALEPAALRVDHPTGQNTVESTATVSVSLSPAATQSLLQQVPAVYRTQINDLLLAALARTIGQWSGETRVCLDLEGHGREDLFGDLDISRTVGWFTTLFPIALEVAGNPQQRGTFLKSIKEQLRQIPQKGIGYGLLRYLQPAAGLQDQPAAPISFNYLGQFDQVLDGESDFQIANESTGQDLSPQGLRQHLIDVGALVSGGQLRLNWSYSSNLYDRQTIEQLAQHCLTELESLIAHCLEPSAGGYSPADFPLAKLSQASLDRALGEQWRQVADLYPLAPLQTGLLFHSLYAPDSGVYLVQIQCTLQGRLDPQIFRRAWQQVIDRYDIFRTGFIWEELAEPLQRVYRQVPVLLAEQDWRNQSPDWQQQALAALQTAERQQPFDLSAPPLTRLQLVRLTEETYELLWTHHHLLLDGWSLPMVLKAVFAAYSAEEQGQPLPLAPVTPYRSYLAWLQEQDLAAAQQFWRQQLRGLTSPTPLLAPPPLWAQAEGYQMARRPLSLELTQDLQGYGRQHQLTLNNLVQGAWALLLSRYSGNEEVVFGVTVSGRPATLAGVEEIVGLFINTLPMRVAIDGQQRVLPWLQALQQQQQEIDQYAYTPLAEIQGWSDLPRGVSLFDSIVVFENYPVGDTVQENSPVQELQIANVRSFEQTNYPLNLIVTPGAALTLEINYDRRCFTAATIDRMLGHLQQVLAVLCRQVDGLLHQVSLVNPQEQQQLLAAAIAPSQDYPSAADIATLVRQQAQHQPQAIALICDQQQWSYGELDQRVQVIAAQLQRRGLLPGMVVGLGVDRSLDMVACLLAIWRLGAVYLPLDLDYPLERLHFMLRDGNAAMILGHQRHLSAALAGELLCIALEDLPARPSGDMVPIGADSRSLQDPAYLLYTSGSTGQPKGVLVDQQALLSHCWGMVEHYQLQEGERVLQFASLNFDPSLEQLLPALMAGCGVVLRGPQVWSAAELRSQIETQGVTVANLPTAYWRQVVNVWQGQAVTLPPSLRLMIVGGEALLPSDLAPWQALQPAAQLLNAYGPTEATITALTYRVPEDFVGDRLPIGQPLPNRRAYIVDASGQLCPIGMPGELCLGGASLAQGYYQQPALTAAKFTSDPWGTEPGARLYRTGDLARYLPDGAIEYLGRIDQQVKIRGFRVELAEIQAVLSRHPGLQDSTVQLWGQPGQQRLVAYYVLQPHADQMVTTAWHQALTQYLAALLPEYMVPSAWVPMAQLPLTPSGKIDRRALPDPAGHLAPRQDFVPPSSPTELALAQIWQEVLGQSQVGLQDNFFALGGDSILSLQIVARAQQAGIPFTFKELFAHPSIGSLAPVVANRTTAIQADQGIVTGPVPLTPIQAWFFDQDLSSPQHYNQSLLLTVPADLSAERLERVLQAIVRHHDALRLQFVAGSDGWAQNQAALPVGTPLQVVDLGSWAPADRGARLTEICDRVQASMDLAAGCLLRAVLFQLGQGQPQRLLLAIHHLAVDGVSWRILLEDIQRAYEQLGQGAEIALPPKTTSWQQWAQRLSTAAGEPSLDQDGYDPAGELDYWQGLAAANLPAFPLDQEGENTIASSATLSVSLSAQATQDLLQRVPGVYHTQINDLLLAALAQTIGNWTGQGIIPIDLEGHGREELFGDLDISRTVGWFTTMFPVQLQVPETGGPGLLIKQVKETLRQVPQKGIGYGLLRYLRRAEGWIDQPPAPISFNYLGQFDRTLDEESAFQIAAESAGADRSDQGEREHLLAIGGLIAAGQLQLSWTYSRNLHQEATIAQLANQFIANLEALIDHCLEPAAGGYTPSDFPLAQLTQGELDRLLEADWRRVVDIYPLSPMQQGMLFHTLYAPDDGMYVELMQCTLQGDLDPELLKATWQRVIDRYDIFRTGFVWAESAQPLQLVYDQVAVPFTDHDWQGQDPAQQQQQLADLVQEATQGFDWSRPPLMRLHLVQLSADTYEFIWSSHHLLLDGWSLPVVFKEVFAAYQAQEQGQAVVATPVIPYRSYIAWLQEQDLAAAKTFWQGQLQGIAAPTPLPMPTDHTALTPGIQSIERSLSPEITEQLQQFGRQHQLTVSNIVQGAWAVLLSRYSGNADVVFGVTVSGRPATLPGVEEIVGLFINTLPLRVTVPSEAELVPWLQALQQQQRAIDDYGYTPLVDIQGWSEVARGVPLFESILVFENYPLGEAVAEQPAGGELEISNVRNVEQTNYPVTLTAIPGAALTLEISYNQERLTATMVEQMLGHLHRLLVTMVQGSQETLGQLSLLDLTEQQQLLAQAIGTPVADSNQQSAIDRFRQQAEQHPHRISLVCGKQQLTYGELAAQVQAMAQQLCQLGVQPQDVVGLVAHRSPEMVVGLLAIMAAGGIYLPLEPSDPLERWQGICNDAEVKAVVGHRSCLDPSLTQALPCLYLGEPMAADRDNESVILPTIALTDPAYLLYTSGSTGKPKGVLVDHQALVAHCGSICDHYQLQAQDRVLQFAAFTFDPALEQLWPALLVGGGVVLRGDQMWSPAELWQQIADQRITIADLPTAYWRQLVPAWLQAGQGLPPQLRLMIVGGEALLPADLPDWWTLTETAACELLNAYGPTEATITALTYRVPAHFAGDSHSERLRQRLPIGRPLPNRRAYILDASGQLCPIGVPGELYLGGIGLAVGYYQQPALTAAQFVPDPFGAPQTGARLYRTGDLARYLPDGQIEYWGRIDQQVKIRGFRVEIAEVESVLAEHPAIQVSVVNPYQIAPGQQRLVAYYLAQPQQPVSSEELRQFLADRLPDYMVPALWIPIDELPVTASGKIDRRALPVPTDFAPVQREFVPPQTEIEMALAEIWQGVLGVPAVGLHDNFFAIGGDSILSLQVIARANQVGINLTFKQLFSHPVIGELAQVAGTSPQVVAEQGLVTGAVPLTPIQEWFFGQELVAPHHYNQSVLLMVPADLDRALLQQALTAMVRHHDALRLQFTPAAGEWQQTNGELVMEPAIALVDLSAWSGTAQTEQLTEICSQRQGSLDLAAGCLLQATLFQMGAGQPQRLLILAHHLVVDGVSWRILLEDIQTAYQQLRQGQPVTLPAKTTSWQGWAQRLTGAAGDFGAELAYWQTQARPQDRSLPIDRPGEQRVASSVTVSASLTAAATQDLLRLVPAVYKTQINDLLLAALARTIGDWTGEAEVYLDLEGHGREELFEDVDISRTVGWFTTIFPVCLRLPGQQQPEVLIKTIKEALRQIPQKGIGYGLLQEILEAPELADHSGAQISFNYLGQFDQTLEGSSDFQLAPESAGWNQDLREQRSHLLDINALVTGGQLQIDWSYSADLYDAQTIEQLAQNYLQHLTALIDHCLEPTAGGYTPSDFPLAALTQDGLDRLIETHGRQVVDIYPLSPMQQGMLFHTIYAPDSGVYVELVRCTLQGDLDPMVFRQAWQQVVDRYDILRTAFVWGDLAAPLQLLYPEVVLPFSEQDWRSLDPEQQQRQLSALVDQERQQGFDLGQPPLMRMHLMRLADQTYEFIWSSHHLLLDGWSLPLVFKEVFTAYHAYEQGTATAILPSPPYRNYIAWLQAQDVGAAQTYWQERLQGITAPTPLPRATDRSELTTGYHTAQLSLSAELTQKLQEFGRQQQLTISNLVGGAWALLLGRYSQESDVVFGVTVSGRPPTLPNVEEMVGLFINTIPCRVPITDDLSEYQVLPWLKDLQAQQVANEQYAYTPLLKIQASSSVPQSVPLFESIVVFENYPIEQAREEQADGVEIRAIESFEQTNFPLTLVAVLDRELRLKLSYDRSRFNPALIEQMLEHCQGLLLGLVSQPEMAIAQLPLLTPAEALTMAAWQPSQSYPSEFCLHQIFEQQVALRAAEIAVVCGDDRWSYGELNRRANQLAHHLRALGVTTESLVGLCVERSLDTIVGILGILKAGGAYVPLDPDYPAERLAFMAQDAQLSVIVTQSAAVDRCPQVGATVVCLDREGEAIAQQSPENPSINTSPENLAYIIYTSGSTGQPKGVLIEHHNVLRLFASTQDNYQFTDRDVWTMFHSYAFDFSVWEIWGALLYGGRLVVVPFWVSRHPQAFSELLLAEQVTVLNQTPSAFMRLMQEPTLAQGEQQLRWVIFGGEALDIPALQPWFERHGEAAPQLINMYGITETTVHVTYQRITQADVTAARGSVIGRPIGDLQLYVLDAYHQQLPIGVAGEMYVGGDGLARGYLNRPELTAERFIANPFQDQGLLYKTGDLARYLANGELEYLGRIDHQVKIRGFRIELGEIEAVLGQHPALGQTVVIASSTANGQQQLVAYLVTAAATAIDTMELREFLADRLPDYMIPAAFVTLPELPLTTNGKVDKKALPAPDLGMALADSYVPPRNEMERQLAKIWADVLGLPQVGIQDNFFGIGGDSILSLQIIARANQAGIQITPKQLFSHPTIASLAPVAGTGRGIQAEQGIVTGSAPLTPIQHWFLEQDLPDPQHFNLSMLLTVPADLSADYLEQVLEAIVSHHDALRLSFTQSDAGWQQHHADLQPQQLLRIIDLGEFSGDRQTAELTELCTQQQASLDLSAGCLLQATLFQMGSNQPQRLLLTVHHLAVDGVSWRILLEDIQQAYQQVSQGHPIVLPAKTTAWKQWAERLASNDRRSELAYWQGQVGQRLTDLPVDRQGENTVGSLATISLALSPAATEDLLRRVPAAYRTQINDLLLAALAQTIGDWTGRSQVYLDLEGHGREALFDDVDISRTVGWFTTIFPVCLSLPSSPQPALMIKAIKEQLRQIPEKGIGYGILRYLQGELTAAPVPQISFNYLGQFDQTMAGESDFQMAQEPPGAAQSLRGQRHHLLDVNGMISDGQLQLDWSYSTNLYDPETIEQLAQNLLVNLEALIAHCLEPESGGYTPSDFPLARLTPASLDDVLRQIREQGADWRQVADIYPLSPMQQGMLFHSLYAPDSGVYMEVFHCTLQGAVDIPGFCAAWQRAIDRYDVFRTGFIWSGVTEPVQYVLKQVALPFTYQDWQGQPQAQQQQQLADLLAAEQQGWDLMAAPLMRLHLVQMAEETYDLIWTHHHLLLDGWSLPLVFQEVFADGQSPVQPTTPYRDYIGWLQAQDLVAAKTFWQEQLRGIIAPTTLGNISGLPLLPTPTHQTAVLRLPAASTQAIQDFARQHQLTINNLVQGAWAILLSRYSGERDVVFGSTVSGRPPTLAGVEEIVGMFINTLPVRVTVEPEQALIPWLQQLQALQQAIDQYSYTPLVEIQGWSEVPRSENLFESIVVFENYPIGNAVSEQPAPGQDLQLTNVQMAEQTNYPLNLTAIPGTELTLEISYDLSRFAPATITQMLEHFQHLLLGMMEPALPAIGHLTLLNPAQQQQALLTGQGFQKTYPDQCLHQLIEAQAAWQPEAEALVWQDQRLTYQALNQQANQLAHYLQAQGVSGRVGIYLERSGQTIVALLAVLKIGAAYVPLDPSYPADRLAYMLTNAEINCLLTTEVLADRLPSLPPLTVYLDRDGAEISGQDAHNLNLALNPARLAYVIYTSGSTGKPKGVMVSHRSLVNAYQGWEQAYQLSTHTRSHLQMASFSFDVFAGDYIRALGSGAKLVICPRDYLLEPAQLYQLIQAEQIDCAEFVPGVMRPLAEYLRSTHQNLGQMGLIIVGSDSWYMWEYQQWRQLCGEQTRLINSYGVSEATIDSCYFETAVVEDWPDQALVPIGKPFVNMQLYVLDELLQPLPMGLPGELYIGGLGVSEGYDRRPDLTATQFIANPWERGERLYKTGDIARYRADGNLEYVGRSDHQVKLRGYRIELGEIAAKLGQYPGITQAIAEVRKSDGGQQYLVSYLVTELAEPPTGSELRQFLLSSLPDYMVPSIFVPLPAFPLTPNGKVDRQALPAPDYSNLAITQDYVPPMNFIEQQLTEIWAAVLEHYPISTQANFFDLGGHSLLAVQLMAQVQQRFDRQLPLATLFQYPTIAEMAAMLWQPSTEVTWSPLLPIKPQGDRPPFFCIPGAGGNPVYLNNLAHYLDRDRPFYGFQAQGLEGEAEPHGTVEEIAQAYLAAMKTVQPTGPYYLGGHSFGGLVAFEIALQLQQQGETVACLAIIDSGAPDLEAVPPLEMDDAEWVYTMVTIVEGMYGQTLEMELETLRALDPEAQLGYFQSQLQAAQLLPVGMGIDQIRGLIAVYKAQAAMPYQPTDRYHGKISFFHASEEEDGSDGSAAALHLAWEHFTTQSVALQLVPGSHYTMMRPPHVTALSAHLNTCLNAAP